jgi:hypothetical protein
MPDFDNYLQLDVRDFEQPDFKRILISTKRTPAMSSGKKGDPVTYLSSVISSPRILADSQVVRSIRAALGLEGTATKLWELRIEKCVHSASVSPTSRDSLPDIIEGDRVVLPDNTEYTARWVDTTHPLSFGEVMFVYLVEDTRR